MEEGGVDGMTMDSMARADGLELGRGIGMNARNHVCLTSAVWRLCPRHKTVGLERPLIRLMAERQFPLSCR